MRVCLSSETPGFIHTPPASAASPQRTAAPPAPPALYRPRRARPPAGYTRASPRRSAGPAPPLRVPPTPRAGGPRGAAPAGGAPTPGTARAADALRQPPAGAGPARLASHRWPGREGGRAGGHRRPGARSATWGPPGGQRPGETALWPRHAGSGSRWPAPVLWVTG